MRTIQVYFNRKLYCSNFGYMNLDQILGLIKSEDVRFVKTKPFKDLNEDSFFLDKRNIDPEEDVTAEYMRKLLIYSYKKKIDKMGSDEVLKNLREV